MSLIEYWIDHILHDRLIRALSITTHTWSLPDENRIRAILATGLRKEGIEFSAVELHFDQHYNRWYVRLIAYDREFVACKP